MMKSIIDRALPWNWRYPVEPVSIRDNEVHIWQAPLDVQPADQNHFYSLLSVEERLRAARLRDREKQQRFIAARGWLRTILWQYVHIAPGKLQFSCNEHGKPFLVHPFDLADGERIEFNLSHSGDLAMYAICRERSVGIDLEWMDERLDMDVVAAKFFSHEELQVYRSVPEKQKTSTFFACWTQKEAYLKARGDGFCYSAKSFSILPGKQSALEHVEDARESRRWSLLQWAPARKLQAALAIEGWTDFQTVVRTI